MNFFHVDSTGALASGANSPFRPARKTGLETNFDDNSPVNEQITSYDIFEK
jgi:hypothetical protein